MICTALLLLAPCPQGSDVPVLELAPQPPTAVEGSARILGELLIPSAPDDSGPAAGALVLRGLRGVVLDLSAGSLRGAPPGADLDGLEGLGVLLEDCADVTLRGGPGGRLGGYRGCIVARRCTGLVLEDLEFEGWYGQRLLSGPAAEVSSDWLWPHENDDGEWLAEYGAAISLTDCTDFTVRRCSGRRGQNGILLTRSSGGAVYDNDFSFLSGWGLGMYRASDNTVCRNRFDYCVRGFSDGVYWRGQDSAGILMFERCSDNLVALNSATHGGDGLFLFAGQDIVEGRAFERGELEPGGSDRNLFWRNDFSHAVANAMELTFSRGNQLVENRCRGSYQHGLWGGYSSRLLARANDFSDTAGGGITVEHGQECAFEGNRLTGCGVGLELYWDPDPELVGGAFGQHFDTASRDHWVAGNRFEGNRRDLVIERSTGVRFGANVYSGERGESQNPVSELPERELVLDGVDSGEREPREILADARGALPSGVVRDSEIALILGRSPMAWFTPDLPRLADLPGERDFRRPQGDDRGGLSTVVMGPWGPWDFEGGDPRPEPAPARVGGHLADAVWEAVWFSWKERADPREELEGWRALGPLPGDVDRDVTGDVTGDVDRDAVGVGQVSGQVGGWLDPFGGDRARAERVGRSFIGLRAETEVELPAGRYELMVLSDDGVRVVVDGRTALERWDWHGPTVDRAVLELGSGTHHFELEYFQIEGALELRLELSDAP